MAVTSIWPIKGRVDQVITYAQNPEKTMGGGRVALHTIDGVLEYAADEMKTEQRSFVTCLNCREGTAADDFLSTKRLWKKTGGRVCYHGYQSFKTDEVTADTAHEIGVKLVQELWGDRFEVMVATHCNTGHYHNHFVINSVSFMDGHKFYNSPADYAKMREVSDRLCREYSLSVVKQPEGKSRSQAGHDLSEGDGNIDGGQSDLSYTLTHKHPVHYIIRKGSNHRADRWKNISCDELVVLFSVQHVPTSLLRGRTALSPCPGTPIESVLSV